MTARRDLTGQSGGPVILSPSATRGDTGHERSRGQVNMTGHTGPDRSPGQAVIGPVNT